MSGKKLYFKLGQGASSFNDPKSGLNIAGDEVAAVDAALAKTSKIVRNAKTNGHIVEVEEGDFKSAKLKAPDVNAEPKGNRSEATAKPSKEEAPNRDKATSHSPSGLPSSAGGQGSNSPADVDDDEDLDEEEEDEDDVEDEDDDEDEEDETPAKKAPSKAAPKKSTKKGGKKK